MSTREKCQNILASNKSDDQKLYDIFQLVKGTLPGQHDMLYYALLGWADAHKRELDPAASAVADYFK